MKKGQRRRKGRLIKKQKRVQDNSTSFRVVGIVDGGSDLKSYGIYPTLVLAKQIALAKRYEESRMTCFVYTDDNRVIFSTEGKE